jgi:hypothetical protein
MGIEGDVPVGTDGSWGNYSYAVLTELKRLNKTQEDMNSVLHEVLQQQAVERQANDDFRKAVDLKHANYDETLFQPKYGLVPRVGNLESVEQVKNAVVLDRKWLIAGGFGIVTALLIPITALIVNALT